MIERQPVAYIRRSFSRRGDPGDVSRAIQTDKVRLLAGDDAATLIVKDRDWGISAAREQTERRLDFLDLLSMVERGEVSTLYAYSADRLARSVRWSAQLFDACRDADTTIVTSEGRYAPGDDAGWQMFSFLALQNEGALRQMKKKAQDSTAKRKERGDYLGPAPYGQKVVGGQLVDNPAENIEAVKDAYRRAGTLQGAARLLSAEGVPTRSGKPWRATTLRGILDRAKVLPRRAPVGRTPTRSYVLSKLLRCPCGATLTGRVNTKGRRGYAYECKAAPSKPGHGPYSVSEARVLPWVRAEVTAHLRTPDVVPTDAETAAERTALAERRQRLTLDWVRSGIGEDAVRQELADIDKAADRLDRLAQAIPVPKIDWTWEPASLNAVLRLAIEFVALGPDLRPVKIEPGVPEWWS